MLTIIIFSYELKIIVIFTLLVQDLPHLFISKFVLHSRSHFPLHFFYFLPFIFLTTFSKSQIHCSYCDFNLFLLFILFLLFTLLSISQNRLSFTYLLAQSDFFEKFDMSFSCLLQQLLAYSNTSNYKNRNKLTPSH